MYVRADARAKYKSVVDVVDNVRAAGVDDLGLLTEQKKQNNAREFHRRRLAMEPNRIFEGDFLWEWQSAAREARVAKST